MFPDTVKQPRLNKKQRLDEVARLARTMTTAEMAKRLGVSVDAIRKDVRFLRVSAKKADRDTSQMKQRQDRHAAVARLAGSMTVEAMAKRFGVSNFTIQDDLKCLGLAEPPESKVRRKQRLDEVARLASSMTVKEMATKLGVAIWTVSNDLKSLGLVAKTPEQLKRKLRQDRQAVVKRLAGSMTVEEMARQLSVRPRTIYSDLQSLGLVLNRSRGRPSGASAQSTIIDDNP